MSDFLHTLEGIIETRRQAADTEGSYVARLFASGTAKIAQKVGEEGVETALAAALKDRKQIVYESADLLFHLLVLLRDAGLTLDDVLAELKTRHKE